MIYLLASDIRPFRADTDNTLLNADPDLLNLAEALALDYVATLLLRYQTGPALAPWQAHDAARPYPAQARVLDGLALPYYALQPVPAGTALEDPTYWRPGDNRPPQLTAAVAALTLAYLLGRASASQGLPPAYAQARDEARAWLLAQATGRLPAVLPLRDDATPLAGHTPPRWQRF